VKKAEEDFAKETTLSTRSYRGIRNLHNLYMPICDEWVLVDNMDLVPDVIAKYDSLGKNVFNYELWDTIKQLSHG
jgi:predicted ABC-type ATPase